MLGKLGDLVGELYLAETEKKKNQLWQRAQKAMEKLNIPQAIINHITEQPVYNQKALYLLIFGKS